LPLARLTHFLSAGAYLQARREADRLIKGGDLAVADEARTWLLACRVALSMRDPFGAARSGERALELALAGGSEPEIAEVHFFLGSAYAEVGDAGQAERHLQAFLGVLPRMDALAGYAAKAYAGLGGAYRQRREWGRAAQALTAAGMRFTLDGNPGEAARCAVSEAWCHLMAGDLPRAGACLGAVDAHLGWVHDNPLAVDALCHRALAARLSGQLGTSTALCEEVFAPARPGVQPNHLAMAAWVAGENALDLACEEQARTFVDLALRHATTANRPDLMNLAGGLRRRILTRPQA